VEKNENLVRQSSVGYLAMLVMSVMDQYNVIRQFIHRYSVGRVTVLQTGTESDLLCVTGLIQRIL
jgi:hypothetical protein